MSRNLAAYLFLGGLTLAVAPKNVMAQEANSYIIENAINGKTALSSMSEQAFTEVENLIIEAMSHRISVETVKAYYTEIKKGKTSEEAAESVGLSSKDLKLLQKWNEVEVEKLNRTSTKVRGLMAESIKKRLKIIQGLEITLQELNGELKMRKEK